jgi:hypothetical protein
MGPLEDFGTVLLFAVGAALTIGPVVLIGKVAKRALWFVVPVLFYTAVVPGAWNGFVSGFDATRFQAMKHLEHMGARGRFRTCNDQNIELSADAVALCERTFKVAPGEPIPGSEHRCGFLGLFGCIEKKETKE